ncbi:MAG: flavin reductase, partial [Rhodobacteraceae bacterium]|nr:flavin reductase [Paracoccaceae bacterium]
MTTPTSFDERAFRDALGRFATGVTIVTCSGPDGPMGITANSFASLSLDPPLVLWSPAKSSRRYEAFMNATEFAIHVASFDQLDLCRDFAKSAGGSSETDWKHAATGCPYLKGGVARFMCQQHATFDG